MHVFLSQTFRDTDRELVGQIEALLSSHDVHVVTGRRLGGEGLTQETMDRIEGADACVAIMTRREQLGDPEDDRWTTHPWVTGEINHARGHEIPSIALVERGVSLNGAYSERERIEFDRESPLSAFLALSDTIRVWREKLGTTRVARLSPDEVGRLFRVNNVMKCRYRFVTGDGDRTEWKETDPITGPGGTLLYLKGVRSDQDQVEVEILEGDTRRHVSNATPQWLAIELEELGG